MKKILSLFALMLSSSLIAACTVEAGPETDDPEEDGDIGEAPQEISGGGSTCPYNDPQWPKCDGGSGPTLPGPDCTGKNSCYCFCRYDHRCDLNPAECDPLAACLTGCDQQYPSYCGVTTTGYPTSRSQCL